MKIKKKVETLFEKSLKGKVLEVRVTDGVDGWEISLERFVIEQVTINEWGGVRILGKADDTSYGKSQGEVLSIRQTMDLIDEKSIGFSHPNDEVECVRHYRIVPTG